MDRIRTEADLRRLISAGEGFLYNDFAPGARPDAPRKSARYNTLHAAGCGTLQVSLTVAKYFSADQLEAVKWLTQNRGAEPEGWHRCPCVTHADGTLPARAGSRRPPPAPAERRPAAAAAEIRGPLPRSPLIEAWIDEYIHFERRSADQEELRKALRERIAKLTARRDQVLHATWLGEKRTNADVENLALYNIDDTGKAFAAGARFGLRFELGHRVPQAPSGNAFRYGYRYELVSREANFPHWRVARTLAEWDWVDLGSFAGDKRLEQVWLALRQARILVAPPIRSPQAPYAVRATIRPPRRAVPRLGGLVKGVIDGVVCGLQTHTDRSTVGELARRVARNVAATPEEIEALLVRSENAVLGPASQLLHLRGPGVIWAPADDLCVAGELLAAVGSGDTWTLKGEVVELTRADAR